MGVVTREWGEVIYAPGALSGSKRIPLDEAERHHLLRVLRVRTGDTVMAVNGRSTAFYCTVESGGELAVTQEIADWGEELLSIHVCCAVLKGDGMREVTDWATALGARSICFFKASRSEGAYSDDKRERLLRVAVAAMKQCGRSRLPEIAFAANLDEAQRAFDPAVLCVAAHPLHLAVAATRRSGAAQQKECALFVGPEGGFSSAEIDDFLNRGGELLDLGQRRLRAELAVMAGIERLRARNVT